MNGPSNYRFGGKPRHSLAAIALAFAAWTTAAKAQGNWIDGRSDWNAPGNWSSGVPIGGIVNIGESDNVARNHRLFPIAVVAGVLLFCNFAILKLSETVPNQ